MITEAFITKFGTIPSACASIPGRVNLIGEHTDYNGGLVLPTPVPRFTLVALGASDHGYDEIKSMKFGQTATVAVDQVKQNHWSDYAAGALQSARAAGWLKGPQRLLIDGDVPDGAGLSSSASLIVAILTAAAKSTGAKPSVTEIARTAQAVECDHIGMPCGIMDQMAVAGGTPGQAMRLDTITLDFDLVPIPQDWHISVVHSGIQRALAEGRYAERRRECEDAVARLNATWLCQLSPLQKQAAEALPAPLSRRAQHAWSDHERVIRATQAIKRNDLKEFGGILQEGHASLRDNFEVSLPAIDTLVDRCVSEGAYGARLTGGGFGGCVVAVLPKADFTAWQERLKKAQPGLQFIC